MNKETPSWTYKDDFPLFRKHPHLTYLDHAATSQKPSSVIDAIHDQMENENGSPNRGAHNLSVKATEIYEGGREKVRQFIGGLDSREIIFTKNATESLNLIAYSYGLNFLKEGDEIVILISSHHSNIVPWQMVSQKTGAKLVYLNVDETGNLSNVELEKINPRTKIVTFPWISNGIGTKLNPRILIERAHENGAVAIVDAAQVAGHEPIDVTALDADFLVFSGHKMFGPQGIGVLFGKYELLTKMPPFLTGGDMIEYVTCFETTYEEVPKRFEAGTQNVSGVRGLVAAIDFIESIGLDQIKAYESKLTQYMMHQLSALPFITVYGPKNLEDRGALVLFNVDGIHPHDVASILDDYGIAIRAGHHCTQPLMQHLGLTATCRASYSIYNSEADVDKLVETLYKVRRVFGYDD